MMKQILSRLTRVTNSQNFIPEVDGLRFLAILPVVLMHLNTHYTRVTAGQFDALAPGEVGLKYVLERGGLGVELFFAISGFILALPFARYHLGLGARVDLKGYYLRRVTRLEPPYIISLLLFFTALVVVMGQAASELFPHLIASLFYVHFFVYGTWSEINPVAWSLETEVQFYLLAPLFASIFVIRSRWLRRLLLVGAILGLMAASMHFSGMLYALHLSKSLAVYLYLFLLGFLVADLYLVDWARGIRRSLLFDGVALLGLAGLFAYRIHPSVFENVLFALSLFAVFVSAFRGKLTNRLFTNRAVVVIGGMCYTIYLLHYPLLAIVVNGTSSVALGSRFWVNFLLQAVLVLPLLLLVSGTYFALIERPTMDRHWPKKLMQGLRKPWLASRVNRLS